MLSIESSRLFPEMLDTREQCEEHNESRIFCGRLWGWGSDRNPWVMLGWVLQLWVPPASHLQANEKWVKRNLETEREKKQAFGKLLSSLFCCLGVWFIAAQNVGITWGFILLRLTSMFPYSITSLNIIKIHVQFFYRPASSCSSSSMSRSNLPFLKGWMEDLELFNWPISSIGC